MKKYYVGNREVDKINVSGKYDLVGILYKDGYNEDFTKAQWEDVRSEKAYPDGEVMIKKHEKLMKRIIKDMKECRVTLLEQEWILPRVSESIGANYRECLRKMFGVKEPENIMLAHIDVILKDEK
jgi:hypothetical protein